MKMWRKPVPGCNKKSTKKMWINKMQIKKVQDAIQWYRIQLEK